MTLFKALRTVPEQLTVQPLFLSIDDTMVEKAGEKFEFRSKLFDHVAHNGSNYLNGHCMVSILLSFPILTDGSMRYLSVPLGHHLWGKKQTKLEIAAEMVRSAMALLPYSDESFSCCRSASAQETRFGIGQQIQASIIFSSFVELLETVKKAQSFIKIIEGYVLSGSKNPKVVNWCYKG